MPKGLLDFLQAASNAVAGNVSGPVDLLNAGLGFAGLGSREPVGGSAWMQRQGLTRPVEQGAAGVLGETAGLLSPIAITANAPKIARGLLQGADNLAKPATMNPQTGAIVWHGSPHKFDKFDSSKIGTGEGAQAYGHGLYLAESPEVAEAYKRSNMFGVQNAFKNTGGELPQIDEVSFLGKRIAGIAGDGAALRPAGAASPGISAGLRESPPGGPAASISNLGYGATPAKLKALAPEMSQAERDALQFLVASDGRADTAASILEAKGKTEAARIVREHGATFGVLSKTGGTGNIYKVDLPDEHIARMLDWDKPLAEQAPAVRAAIEKTRGMLPPNALDDLGGDLSLLYGDDVGADSFLGTMNSLQPKLGETLLGKAGVPGVRYLDQQSRNAGKFKITPPSQTVSGKWMVKGTDYNSNGLHFDTEAEALAKLREMNAGATSNYVVFPGNEGLLSILERNGKPLR